jgi:serine-type D-Ala-D-Ala carboxypeptidase/endopeptidase (penicillin-binding protein 4)
MKARVSVALFALLFASGELLAQQAISTPLDLARAIDSVIDDPRFENAHWGVIVVDLTTGRTLYERNANRSFVPASNAKLYTTAAALALLGPGYRYETALFAGGDIRDGELAGNLYVRAGGDPTIGGRFTDGDRTFLFRQWADSLRALGVQRIQGDLIGDDDVFDALPLGAGWAWDNEPFWYSAEISGLSFNEATVNLTILGNQPGMPATITWEPGQTDYVEVRNRTLSVSRDAPHVASYGKERGSNELVVASRVPHGQTIRYSLSISNPTLYFLHEFRRVLIAEGISFGDGRIIDVDEMAIRPDYTGLRRVASHRSVPLSEIVEVINKPSQNLYAEHVLKTLGTLVREAPEERPHAYQASARDGVRAAMPFFGEAGLDTTRIQLRDGSGLTRTNLVTPRMTTTLLRRMWYHPDASIRGAFLASLPVGGVDGTLAGRMTEAPSRGNVRAKTGTLSNVTALSGYVTTTTGTPLAFAIMNNHHTRTAAEARAAEDRIAAILASYR